MSSRLPRPARRVVRKTSIFQQFLHQSNEQTPKKAIHPLEFRHEEAHMDTHILLHTIFTGITIHRPMIIAGLLQTVTQNTGMVLHRSHPVTLTTPCIGNIMGRRPPAVECLQQHLDVDSDLILLHTTTLDLIYTIRLVTVVLPTVRHPFPICTHRLEHTHHAEAKTTVHHLSNRQRRAHQSLHRLNLGHTCLLHDLFQRWSTVLVAQRRQLTSNWKTHATNVGVCFSAETLSNDMANSI
jgi:hypothetical protein